MDSQTQALGSRPQQDIYICRSFAVSSAPPHEGLMGRSSVESTGGELPEQGTVETRGGRWRAGASPHLLFHLILYILSECSHKIAARGAGLSLVGVQRVGLGTLKFGWLGRCREVVWELTRRIISSSFLTGIAMVGVRTSAIDALGSRQKTTCFVIFTNNAASSWLQALPLYISFIIIYSVTLKQQAPRCHTNSQRSGGAFFTKLL